MSDIFSGKGPDPARDAARIAELELALNTARAEIDRMKKALEWIATTNATVALMKLAHKTLIGMIYELRGKAKQALEG